MGPESASPRLAAPLPVAIPLARSSALPPSPGVPSRSPRISITPPGQRMSQGAGTRVASDPPSLIHHQLRT